MLLHEQHYPKPVVFYGGSWAAEKAVKPLSLRPRNLRLVGQTVPPPASPAEICGVDAALQQIMNTPEAATALMRPLLLEPSLRDLVSAAMATKTLNRVVAHALRGVDVMLPARKIGAKGSRPGMFTAPNSDAG